MKSSREIRQAFLSFFENKEHEIVKSAPIVLKNDPTLKFTNAGMNQFKDIFLGLKSPSSVRVADTQKCLRVTGKHNDLEDVGHDTYHHTMFEMLGNWSFGDYYKSEATAWAWEFLTEVLGIDPNRLYVSIFEGAPEDNLPKDEEALEAWKRFLPEDRILPYDKKDNFWEMGDTGPCGPCSEIHMDLRSDEDRAKVEGKTLVNADHPQVVEIWNLVFIQFNRKADGSLEELPNKHVDTGMGFERLVMSLQNKQSTYDIDLFDRTRGFMEALIGQKYVEADENVRIAIRVIIDHIRAIVFAIADGETPKNEGAGYVIRRILRRAMLYAYKSLNIERPFLYEMVALLAEEYKGVFEEVEAQLDFVSKLVHEEEKSFLRNLKLGLKKFNQYLKTIGDAKVIDGDFAFKLYDTYGFPVDMTQLLAKEQNLEVDMMLYEKHLEEQRNRSRESAGMEVSDWIVINDSDNLPLFKGYDSLELQTNILRYRTVKKTVKKKKETQYQLVLAETPFYAESGGQIGDTGSLTNGEESIKVLDTKKENELIVHFVNKFPHNPEGVWTARVNSERRRRIKANHTATHLLHAALRNHLGKHVEQRGSLVSDKALRFDFSHFQRVTSEELEKIEAEVNQKIALGIPLTEHRSLPIDEAKNMGAMALFGEKYGDEVRVVIFDEKYSVELCGGTHVSNTSDIRLFKLISEGSVAAGIRRVEAYTSDGAIAYINQRLDILDKISETLKSPKNLEKAVVDLTEKAKNLEREIQQLNAEKIQRTKNELLQKVESINGIQLIRAQVALSSGNSLKQLSYDLKNVTENTLIVLAANINGKPQISVIMSDDLAKNNKYHAGNMVRTLAKEIKGGGGGQPFFATAGGKDVNGLHKVLEKVVELL